MLKSGFFDSLWGDRYYSADDFGGLFDGIITDGIIPNYKSELQVGIGGYSGYMTNAVVVKPGRAWFNRTWTYIDSNYTVSLNPPHATLDRYDVVVLEVNKEDDVRENSIVVITGEASSNPVIPNINYGIYGDIHRYPLGLVHRRAGRSAVYATDITDMRGTEQCPFARTIVSNNFSADLDNLDQRVTTLQSNVYSKNETYTKTETIHKIDEEVDDLRYYVNDVVDAVVHSIPVYWEGTVQADANSRIKIATKQDSALPYKFDNLDGHKPHWVVPIIATPNPGIQGHANVYYLVNESTDDYITLYFTVDDTAGPSGINIPLTIVARKGGPL